MSKLFVVFGATGQQGGSVIRSVLQDAELCTQYKIRGVTRDPTSTKARALRDEGVDVVKADVNNEASIPPTLEGAYTVFIVTAYSHGSAQNGSEWAQGKAIADAAVAQGVKFIIFSTLPHVKALSGGKYTQVRNFDAKAEIEAYIRDLPIESAFIAPGTFMQNCSTNLRPEKSLDGNYYIKRYSSPETQLPLIDAAGDVGKFVGAILAEPEKYKGRVICAATRLYSLEEIARNVSKATGKIVRYRQRMEKETLDELTSPPRRAMMEMMQYQQDFGYYGSDTLDLVARDAQCARGRLTTFEEFLEKNALLLD